MQAQRAQRLKQITVWGNPDEKFPTQYGVIEYSQWCELEKERIKKICKKECVVKTKDNQIALFENY